MTTPRPTTVSQQPTMTMDVQRMPDFRHAKENTSTMIQGPNNSTMITLEAIAPITPQHSDANTGTMHRVTSIKVAKVNRLDAGHDDPGGDSLTRPTMTPHAAQ